MTDIAELIAQYLNTSVFGDESFDHPPEARRYALIDSRRMARHIMKIVASNVSRRKGVKCEPSGHTVTNASQPLPDNADYKWNPKTLGWDGQLDPINIAELVERLRSFDWDDPQDQKIGLEAADALEQMQKEIDWIKPINETLHEEIEKYHTRYTNDRSRIAELEQDLSVARACQTDLHDRIAELEKECRDRGLLIKTLSKPIDPMTGKLAQEYAPDEGETP